MQVRAPLEGRRICELMHTALERLTQALANTPHQALKEVDVLPEAERQQILEQWNDTQAPYPSERCIHELFEQQVARTPDAVAVQYEDQSLSYQELNRRANQLAHYLRAQGVGPDERVGICVERSLEMVVGLLGILKAGGAYVPLDPSYPAQRLAYMLSDSAPSVVLVQGAHEAAAGIRVGCDAVLGSAGASSGSGSIRTQPQCTGDGAALRSPGLRDLHLRVHR